jgi:hypothetical protein
MPEIKVVAIYLVSSKLVLNFSKLWFPREEDFPVRDLIENLNFLKKKGYVVKKRQHFFGEKSDINVLEKVPKSSKLALKLLCAF